MLKTADSDISIIFLCLTQIPNPASCFLSTDEKNVVQFITNKNIPTLSSTLIFCYRRVTYLRDLFCTSESQWWKRNRTDNLSKIEPCNSKQRIRRRFFFSYCSQSKARLNDNSRLLSTLITLILQKCWTDPLVIITRASLGWPQLSTLLVPFQLMFSGL